MRGGGRERGVFPSPPEEDSGKGARPLLRKYYYFTSKWSILVLYLTEETRTRQRGQIKSRRPMCREGWDARRGVLLPPEEESREGAKPPLQKILLFDLKWSILVLY